VADFKLMHYRQAGVLDQLLRQQYSAGLRDGDRRSAEVLPEQASQLTPAHTQPGCPRLDVSLIERAGFDQSQSARNRIGASAPDGEVR
jgi:hypothetical protein